MLKHMILALALGVIGLPGPAAADPPRPLTVHVAPDGSDTNPGTRARPFATIRRGLDAVRAARREAGTADVSANVLVHGGTYSLTAPLVLGPEDSGTAAAPLVIAAAPGEAPVVSGGRRIGGWKEVSVAGRKLWAADVPDVKDGRWYFHELWVNGRRRTRARHPNDGFLKIAGVPDAPRGTPFDKGQDRFQFAAGDLKRWDNLADVDVVVLHYWVVSRRAVEGLDEKGRMVTLAGKSHLSFLDGSEPARYYVENALELLDAPGEWYLDRKAGVLYYAPMAGEAMATAEVVAPVLARLVTFAGRPDEKRYVEHVTLRGLTFAHAEWWPERAAATDEQAAVIVPAAVHGDGMHHCALEDCAVAHVGTYAVHLARGCRDNRVVGCDLFDLGAGGVRVGETVVRDDEAQQTHGNAVTDNHIHDAGRVFHQAVAVWVGQSYANRVAHNHVHDLYYTGISCGWTWGYGKSLARDNLIAFNDVHDLGKGWLSDMGGVYTLGAQPGTVVRGNVFHDIAGYRYGGWGIYFDEGSTGIVAENNLVYRTTHGGFHQHYGKDNVVRNNVFALGRDAQLERTRAESHRSFTFERNVVYYRTDKLLAGKWDDDQVALDNNLYWRDGGAVRFGDQSWEAWRSRRRDGHSLVADPLFADPDRGDFRLKPGSPAEKVGFKTPDLSGVGPRAAGKRD
ncbi:MAG TPA: right-handed parallel beta-helix repeat-containing protein [Gemmataceae bacterium]|nr:right-handed parallel beta-helix repeat-containing protein [Gemmataceae bacterium]